MIETCVTKIDWDSWEPQQRGVLCFIFRAGQVLLIVKKRGLGGGKVNAPGGKIDPGETPLQAAIRETQEEVGLTPHDPRYGGELYFQFTDGFRLHCTVFKALGCDGVEIETCEALPFWKAVEAIPYHQMWEDDFHWLPHLVADRPFRGFFIFDDDKMLSHRMEVGDGPIGKAARA